MNVKEYRNGVGPTESQIQSDFFSWLSLHEKQHPELSLFYAIPNGSHKSPAARGLHKRTGLKAGVPDVHCPLAVAGVRGLWIEFKAKRGVLSDVQNWWILRLKCSGHRVEICRSWTDAANITIEYLNLDIPRL